MADVGIIVFPGSNCDRDVFHVVEDVLGHSAAFHWYKDPIQDQYKAVVLPGGFSYGDYLRAGAIAKLSPAVESLDGFIEKGGHVLGICNGFQILVEAGFLPGAMMKNQSLLFQCEDVFLKVESHRSSFLSQTQPGQILRMPIAHSEGRYVVDAKTVKELEANNQIALRYCGPQGEIGEEFNANGSTANIAGVINKKGNVLGLMPHPERCSEFVMGNTDGLSIFQSLEAHL